MELCEGVGGYEKKEMKKAHGQKKKRPKKKKNTVSQVSHYEEASKQPSNSTTDRQVEMTNFRQLTSCLSVQAIWPKSC